MIDEIKIGHTYLTYSGDVVTIDRKCCSDTSFACDAWISTEEGSYVKSHLAKELSPLDLG